MIELHNLEDFEKNLGKEVVSEYKMMSQEEITQFANLTGDHNWIHIDTERASKESPFDNSTIVHGYLTLAMAPYFLTQMFVFPEVKMAVNYGVDNLRFMQPVKSGSNLRLRAHVEKVKNLRGRLRATFQVTFEAEGSDKPSLKADLTYLYELA